MEDQYVSLWPSDIGEIIAVDTLAKAYLRTTTPVALQNAGADALGQGWISPPRLWVCRAVHCGRWASINEQFVLRRYTHVKGYDRAEWRGEEDLFPVNAPDRSPAQAPQTSSHASPPFLPGATPSPARSGDSKTAQYSAANVGDLPIKLPLQNGLVDTLPRLSRHQLEYHPGFLPHRFPNGQPTQNPEAARKVEVAERRRVRNDRRTEKMRNIRHLLSNFGGMREKRPSSLKILRRAALRLKVPLGPQPPAPHTGALTKREEKASRERRGRREATYIYDCLGQHLLGGCKDRDLILDEVIVALQREGTIFIESTPNWG